jgi:protein-export membrane protein SecD
VKKSTAIVVLAIFCALIVLGVVFACVSLDKGQLGVYDYIAYPKNISLGLDLVGGVYAVFEPKADDSEDLASRMEGTADALEKLLFDKGYTEAVVELEDNNSRIRVEVPDVDDPEEIFNLIGRPASIEFRAEGKDEAITTQAYVTGKDLESAYVSRDNDNNFVVALKFNDQGATKFANATSERLNKALNIWINGEWYLGPTVNSVISNGQAIITGNYTYEDAYKLATQIQAGAFDVELTLVESNTITASLGANSLKTSIIAGLIGIALVIVFMIVFYKMLGVGASLALMIYATFYIFFLSIFPWVQLTLSGIAGIVLSIGMAVDANIVVFSRIRDEYKSTTRLVDISEDEVSGRRSVRSSIKLGFRKATPAILDGNITTILGCVVMLFVGGSSIKSFAITLMIGVIISVITAMFVTRVLVYSLYTLCEDRKNAASMFNLSNAYVAEGAENE